ncbi:DUF2752 domain-containing protein [Mycobacterium servetii]|uniref:DUF2752 domain-containing protein n=1 Tax=Mycobacterium servetii TaxID=3237418 RepID=A0ABV4C208_9MYCO
MAPEEASRAGPRLQRLYTAAGTSVLLAGALGYVARVDPHHAHSLYPPCPFKWLTGWNCPLCGGLRMTHDLLHGDLPAAVSDNLFALVGIPLLAGWLLLRRRHGREPLPIPAALAITLVAAVWTVVRNLPGFPLVPTVLGG